MTIEELYEKIGGSYADVSSRLPSLRLVEKFVGKFLDDNSFETLEKQLELRSREGAFMAAHTLKGISANLGFTKLMDSAGLLTEALRPQNSSVDAAALALFATVKSDYNLTAETIRLYFGNK